MINNYIFTIMTYEELIDFLSPEGADEDGRKYGFKHIKEEYKWMSPGWIEKLIHEENDKEVADYVSWMLKELTTPENSRLESSTDNMDSIEEYVSNRLIYRGITFEEDKVYYWLLKSIDFFAEHDAFELCYNIKKAIKIIKESEEAVNNAPVEYGDDGLPF